MSSRTRNNLNAAMQSEAMTHIKLMRFAAAARMNGNWELAKLFQVTADADRLKHFGKQAELMGLVRSDADNLRSVIADKASQAETYESFRDDAIREGDATAAGLFETLRREELTHFRALEMTRQTLDAESTPDNLVQARSASGRAVLLNGEN